MASTTSVIDEVAPVPTALGIVDALSKYDHKIASGGKVDEAMFSGPTPGEKSQKLLIGPLKLKDITVETLFKHVFASNSTFLREYHEKRRDSDMTIHPWEMNTDRSCGVRLFSCTTLVDHPRPDTPTAFNEAHRFVLYKDAGRTKLLMQLSAQTPNVPFGTSFRVETWMHFEEDGANNVDVTIFGGTKKMSFAFTAIGAIAAPRAIRELKAGYKMLLDMIAERLLSGQDISGAVRDDASPAPIVGLEGTAGAAGGLAVAGAGGALPLGGGGVAGGIDLGSMLLAVMCVVVVVVLGLSMSTHNELLDAVGKQRALFAKHIGVFHTGGVPGAPGGAGPRSASQSAGPPIPSKPQPSVLDGLLRNGAPGASHGVPDAEFDEAPDSDDEPATPIKRRGAFGRAALDSPKEGISWLTWLLCIQSLALVGGAVYMFSSRK